MQDSVGDSVFGTTPSYTVFVLAFNGQYAKTASKKDTKKEAPFPLSGSKAGRNCVYGGTSCE